MKTKVKINKRHINKQLCKHSQKWLFQNQSPRKTKSGQYLTIKKKMINEEKYHKKEIKIMEKGLSPSSIFKTFLRAQHSGKIKTATMFFSTRPTGLMLTC